MTPLLSYHGVDYFPRTAFSWIGSVFPADEAVHFFPASPGSKPMRNLALVLKKFLLQSDGLTGW
ncbi:MAG TPA: hypothetical protein VJY62_05760 [Bacteroidia bacterium]|nr:hypothetical protein [Bacteroidia bacterium]